jgi:outer membrane protein OmpA-like peptidoglycan-associated protein
MRAALRGAALLLGSLVFAATTLASEPTGRDEIIGRLVPITDDEGLRAVDLDVQFELGSARLTPLARTQLDEVGHALASPQLAGMIIGIYGHTDASGPADYNKQLSQERAEAVRAYLVENFDLDAGRLLAVGYGEERLKNAVTPTAAENRRVQIVNLSPPPPQPMPMESSEPPQPMPMESREPVQSAPEAPSAMPGLEQPQPGGSGGMRPIN